MERFEYIDDYFKNAAIPEKQKEFEDFITNNEGFAEDVTFYLNTVQVARDYNNEVRKKHFEEIYRSNLSTAPVKRMWNYQALIAAALVAVFFGIYLYTTSSVNPSSLADQYLTSKIVKLNLQMGSSVNPLQQGKDLYNKKDYHRSLQLFEEAIQQDRSNFYAKEYAGLAALQSNDYQKAMTYFKQVADNEDLVDNKGKFYEALTLMKRNQVGDKEQYVKLLKEIADKSLFGKDEAKKFLDEF